MKTWIVAAAGAMLWACAAHAGEAPDIDALKKQFETEATLANVDSADADEAFKYGAGEDGCASLKLAADDYARAIAVLVEIRTAVQNGANASDDPKATQLERLDAAVTQYQGYEADTRDTLKIACE